MDLSSELEGLFGAKIPLLHFVTYEEQRVIQAILELKPALKLSVYAWDGADSRFVPLREGTQPFPAKEATTDTVLRDIAEKAPPNTIFIMNDFHHSWTAQKAKITRKLRNMAPELHAKNQFLVFTTPVRELPVELKDDVVTIDVPLPDTAALARLFEESTRSLDRSALPSPGLRDKIISSAIGLTTNQARLAFSRVWATHHRYDERGIDIIISLKQQVIRESGALEFWPAAESESVGGLDLMKAWLVTIEKAFSAEAAGADIPRPRGVALVGIPGTGKQPLYGYQGDRRPETAEVIVRRKDIGPASNDIGFKRQSSGEYQAIISEYDRRRFSESWLQELNRNYAYSVIQEQVRLPDLIIEGEQMLENGDLVIILSERG